MLSTNTLAAFSQANATASLNRAGPVRLAREPVRQSEPENKPLTGPVPPAGRQPRGSILNLRV